jgi:hypothetical protein
MVYAVLELECPIPERTILAWHGLLPAAGKTEGGVRAIPPERHLVYLFDSDVAFRAKARIVGIGGESRAGVRFVVIEPALFEQLQHWTDKKIQEEGWDFPRENEAR